ncbi:helix-turn-helix domain-containing protein [Streptomyces sp. NPDC001194]|uniref:nSTAND1 domain-containing NTPase n=1 Tax=Streptomyces sp. NPDC001194 TaxID=3364547 RepID=UPI00367BE0E4
MDPTPFHTQPPLTREEFAIELTRLREKTDLTVRAVAARVGAPGAHSTIGGWFAGQNLPSLGSLPLFRRVLHACGVTDAAEIDRWLERLAELRRSGVLRVAGGASPYRGLAGFEERHADWFFGRDDLRAVIVDRILAEEGADVPRLLVGASGSGKSSLLRAGVLPVLRGEHGCTPLLLAPGRDPMRALVSALSPLAALPAEDALAAEWADLVDEPLELAARVAAVARRAGVRIVVAVDQLEEVFTACPDPAAREGFLRCLEALPAPDVRVTGCLRADFYGQALDQPSLAAALQKGQTVVGALSDDEIRAVVGGPAAKARLVLDEGFIDVLLADLRDSGPGALPLLSHALLSTWERGRGTALTIADYRAGGGMSAAVSETAEEVYAGLSQTECARARQLFLRMVAVGDGVPDARRLLPLPPPVGQPDRAGDVYAVLERFVDRRLVTLDGDGARITHEALLTAWPRLRGWIDADRTGQIVRQDLTRDADRWIAHDRDPSLLYRGTRLAVTSGWARDSGHAPEFDARESEFLDASRLAEDGRVRRERRGARRLRRLLVLLSLLVVLSGLLTGVAVVQRRDAQRQQAVALSRLVAARAERLRGSDLALSAQLGLVAYRTAPTAEAREALMDASALPAVTRILAFRGVVQAVALSPDGHTLAAGGLDHQVALWDLRDPQRPRALGAAPVTFADTVYALAFSPDGRRLAAGSGDGTVRVWEPSAPDPAAAAARSFKGPDSAVYGVAFAPDGKTLAAAGADGGVYLWPDPEVTAPSAGAEGSSASNAASRPGSSATGTRLTGFTGAVHTVAFRSGPGAGAALLAAGGADGSVRLWDLADPGHPLAYGQPLTGAAGPVFGLAFTADGARLVAGSQDRSTRVWEVPAPGSAPAPPAVIGGAPAAPDGPASYVNAVACSPDGQWLATGSADNQVRLYDARTRVLAGVFPHPGPVTSISFHPGGRQMVTAAADGTVRLWQLPPRPLRGFQGTVNAIGYAPDGKLLAVGGRDVQLWDVSDPWTPRPVGQPLTNPTGYSATVSFSPDGRTLAVGGREGKLWLWDVSRPDRAAPYGETLTGGTGTIQSAAFDRTGRILAVGSEGRTVRLWNTVDPAHPQLSAELSEPTNYVYSVAFSPDGRWLAAGTVDKQVLLWRLPQGGGRPVLESTLRGPGSYVMSVAFSPDSRILAAGTADRDVWLWDVSGGHPRTAGPTLTGPSSYVYALAFAPEGGTLAAASTDGTVWLWDTADPRRTRPRTVLSGLGGKAYAVAYSPDGRSLAAGGAGPVALLWSRDEEEIARRLCERAGSVITAQEWAQLVPGLPYAPPCR